jgi:hypothetical protein
MSRAESSQDLSDMVAVAAGSSASVAEWLLVLRRAGFRPVTADSCSGDDYAEVWVRRDNAEKALGILRASGGKQLIW